MLTNVPEITMHEYLNLLEFTIVNKRNLLILGSAGSGKTEAAQALTERLKMKCVYLNLSVLEAPDLVGLPILTKESRVDYALPIFFPLESSEPTVLLIDEADKAKPELQNPLLELLQFRSINGRKLNIESCILTGNLPDEGAHSGLISTALTNRCMVFKLETDFETWQEWAVNAGVNSLVVAFLSRHPNLLKPTGKLDDPTEYCRPSPRAWTLAGFDLDATPDMSLDMKTNIVAGRVGSSSAVKFRVWLDHYQVIEPKIKALIEKGVMPDIQSESIDRIFIYGIAAASAIRKFTVKEKVQKAAKHAFQFLEILPPEIQIGAVRTAFDIRYIEKFGLTSIPEVMKVYSKINASLKG